MSVLRLLNQDGTIYAKSGYNKFGRDTSGSTPVLVKCRFQNQTKTKLLPNGQTIMILGTVYLRPDTVINTEDRIVISGINYKVFSVNGAIDGRGDQRIIKCEVEKWQV